MIPLRAQRANIVFDEELRQSAETLAESLLRCVVPIFCDGKSGKPILQGTGFLIEDAKNSYLISAAHVFDLLKSNRDLFFYVGTKHIRKLAGSLRLTIPPNESDRGADRLDIGVLRLEGEALPPYPEINKQALPITALMESAQPRTEKQYLVTGFPGSQSRLNPISKQFKSKPYGNWMQSVSEKTYVQVGCSPDHHIVMRFDQHKVFGKVGAAQSFPNPEGMSGSPVWLLYNDLGANDPNQTPIVGVFIEYHRHEKLVVATDIRVALDIIRDAF